MTPRELRERPGHGEDAHTDVKRQLGTREELAEDLVCFAKGEGGQIILGVGDDLHVVGVDDPEPIFLTVDDVAFHRCRPPVSVALETVELHEGRVVVVHVARGDQRPTPPRAAATTCAAVPAAATPVARSCSVSSRPDRTCTSMSSL